MSPFYLSKPRQLIQKMLLVLGIAVMMSPTVLNAQKDVKWFWNDVSEWIIPPNLDRKIIPDSYRTLALNLPEMVDLLATAPELSLSEADQTEVLLQLPMPDGSEATFRVFYAPIMHPDLAKKYPDIRVYAGEGVDDPTATIRFDVTPKGFHAMIRSAFHSTVFIDPYAMGTTKYYISYFRKDFKKGDEFVCLVDELTDGENPYKAPEVLPEKAGDCQHRNYRLALACTGEYATYHGGTVAGALAAMNTSMARVNSVLENDLNITFTIIPNNDEIIFLNPGTDPYTNGNGGAMLGQNQTTCDNIIGSANYDIGHVFSTGGGGVANLRSVCTNSKARGVTGSGNPIGDPFDIDYVAHEMGHQLGGNHTQNNNCNRVSAAAREPGSASTIMGYAGICPPNVQSNSDGYYHAYSIQEITAYMVNGFGNSCAQTSSSSNDAPSVNAGANYTIPKSTPFTLTATASDPDGDGLSYCWEQMDNQIATMPPLPSNSGGPAFRSLYPTGSPSRTFPNLPAIVANQTPTWEVLPSVGRTLSFRVTVRDNVAGGGCTDEDDMVVTVASNSGPFQVTNPNTLVVWGIASQQTVNWEVAGSNQSPVSTPNVDILLSVDGGFTYPFTLATNTPNDGSHQVTVPNSPTNNARVMVRGAGNIFFDISDENFIITQTVPITLTITGVDVSCFEGLDGLAQVVASGGDGNFSYSWSNGASTAVISNLMAGTYTVTVTDDSGGSATGSVTIIEPDELVASVTSQDVSCGGIDDGSATVQVSGGTMPNTYQWTGPNDFMASTATINGLAAGNYFVTVVDFNGCIASSSAIIIDDNQTYYRDMDGDNFGDPANATRDCDVPPGYVIDNTDCDDNNATVNPIAPEICDGLDNNCNNEIDEGISENTFYADADGDGYGDPDVSVEACIAPEGYVGDNTDCDDDNATVNPEAPEICDGLDNNCNGDIDEGVSSTTYYADVDGDGYGDPMDSVEGCTVPDGYVANDMDCDDTNEEINPEATETCDGIDNNCDGFIDEGLDVQTYYADSDGDGFGDPMNSVESCMAPDGYVANDTDCDDTNEEIHPSATEICDGVDNNCNGMIDEGELSTFYADTDMDGFGDPDNSQLSCEQPTGYVANSMDCDDTNANVNPNAEEVCDGVDNDCNGEIDELDDCDFVFERGMVTAVGEEWTTVQLQNAYNSMVVIATSQLVSSAQVGVVTRIRNATGNTFELKIQRPDAHTNDTYDVYYFVVEEGVYTQAGHGIALEARKVDAEQTAGRSHWVFEERAYANTYAEPVVLGQVMTDEDERWSVFWASANGDRTSHPTDNSFAAGKHVGEDVDPGRVTETIGYVVVESGTYTFGDETFTAAVGEDLIRGPVSSLEGRAYDTGLQYVDHAVLSVAGMDGGDGGFPVLFGESPFNENELAIAFEEDLIRDNERKHASEQVAYLAFADPAPDPVYCGAEGMGTSYEWIEAVNIGDLNNASGDNGGYGDFTAQILDLVAGQDVAINLTPGFTGDAFPESWRVWIDFNRDGDFEDADELVFAPALSSTVVTGNFTVPNTIISGATLMRISMKWNASPEACEAFSWGEVEDYTVMLTNTLQSGEVQSRGSYSTLWTIGAPGFYTYTERIQQEVLQLFPNPTSGTINLLLNAPQAGNGTILVVNHLGRKIQAYDWKLQQGNNSMQLDVSQLPNGVYTLLLTDTKLNTSATRFVVQH